MQLKLKSFYYNKFLSKTKTNLNEVSLKFIAGFTLVELMVSISIITVIMSVVIFSYNVFNDELSLNSAAQEISISMRQAQIYGLSVKENTGATCGNAFCAGYGIYFSMDDPTNYYLFVDQNNNGKYDGNSSCSSGSECVEKDTIRNGIKISNICGRAFGGTLVCPPDSSVRAADFTFLRPNPDAIIRFVNSAGGFYGGTFQTGSIVLVSPQGKISTITIENTGQISVQ